MLSKTYAGGGTISRIDGCLSAPSVVGLTGRDTSQRTPRKPAAGATGIQGRKHRLRAALATSEASLPSTARAQSHSPRGDADAERQLEPQESATPAGRRNPTGACTYLISHLWQFRLCEPGEWAVDADPWVTSYSLPIGISNFRYV
jgi:hypothetical protein